MECMINLHWMPYLARCRYCSMPYMIIGKMENMEEDLHYISEMAGVQFLKGVVLNKSKGGSTASLTTEYFKQLNKSVIRELYKIYQLDFQLFGYSPDTFIHLH